MTGALRLREAALQLQAAGVPDPMGDARRLLAHALGISPDRLTLHLQEQVSPEAEARFAAALKARERRQPVSQIIGKRLFWGRNFRVTRDTLDPRPETETLVAEALRQPFQRVLDLGTGTGCILISLLLDMPAATGVGCDISRAALTVAKDNAEALGAAPQAAFALSDWFAEISGRFDLIVANPPYITAEEMAALSADVHDWEPHLALSPGGDGLEAYRRLAAGAPAHLVAKGRIMVEIGPSQASAVSALFSAAGLEDVRVLQDLDGRDRVVVAIMPSDIDPRKPA